MKPSDVCLLLLSLLICVTAGNANNVTTRGCRFPNGPEMQSEDFRDLACKFCYVRAPKEVFTVRLNVSMDNDLEGDFWKNKSHPYYLSFSKTEHAERWASCCDNAANCCESMVAQYENNTEVCSMTWDEYGCWPKSTGNREVEIDCPNHYRAYYTQEKSPCERYSRRMCHGNGTWGEISDFCDPMEFQRYKPNYEPQKSASKVTCHRTQRQVKLSYEAYKQDTCAKCYDYTANYTRRPNKSLEYDSRRGYLFNPLNDKEIYFADDEIEKLNRNYTGAVINSFMPNMANKWIECCQSAIDCWYTMEYQSQQGPAPEDYCPMTWDGWSCVKATPPGKTFSDYCADHVYFSKDVNTIECMQKYLKVCRSDGYWHRRSYRGSEYTDYTPCSGISDIRAKLIVDIVMLTFSMVGMVPALIIFNIYRSLRIPRIKMHVQLLTALFLYCLSAVLFKGVVLLPETTQITINNGAFCKILNFLYKYFRLSSYIWMFCEGFYLHRQIAAAFSEQRKFWHFYAAGWGFPLLITGIYAILRKVNHDATCWIHPVNIEFILYTPALVSLVMNLVFLCHIVYILVTKLRSVQSNETGNFRKAVRATLVLIPLFGIQFFFILYSPDNRSCITKSVIKYFGSIIDGLQGFSVALLYCYLNNEVLNLLKNDYHRYKSVRWIGQGNQRPSRGGRWSVSTQVSAVQDHHSTHHNDSNGKSIAVSHLDVPTLQPHHNTNGTLPVTEL